MSDYPARVDCWCFDNFDENYIGVRDSPFIQVKTPDLKSLLQLAIDLEIALMRAEARLTLAHEGEKLLYESREWWKRRWTEIVEKKS